MSAAPPYAGLKVLDLSQGIAGPYCSSLLAQQGADVIKVEPPGGDWVRNAGGGRDGMTPLVIAGNLGKRSIVVDAQKPAGRELLLRMAARADVVVENNRPGVIERLGLGYGAIAAANPAVVYLSITGFGPDGPDAQKAGTDSILQSITGMCQRNRDPDGTPRRMPLLIPDTVTAVYAAQAVGAALYARGRDGRGRHLRLSLLESAAAFQAAQIVENRIFAGAAPPPNTVPSGVFRTRDGHISLSAVTEGHFRAALRVLGLEAWIDDPRFADPAERKKHAALVNDEVGRRLAAQTTAHWVAKLAAADALFAEIADYPAFVASPQARHLGAFAALEQPPYGVLPVARTPGADHAWPLRPAPRMGEHGEEILRELGLDQAAIGDLVRQGAIRSRSG
ncbi:MAG TPA: CoA transferase [Burkholderiales bacterium]|nr:CoA transferase [Burkholderiales bacterium]